MHASGMRRLPGTATSRAAAGCRLRPLASAATALALLLAVPLSAAGVTDAEVQRAIEKGKEYLIGQQNRDGSFGKRKQYGESYSCIAFMTLAYMRTHPNREVMTRGLDFLMKINPDADLGKRQGYALPMRVMGLSYIYRDLLGQNRVAVHQKMREDIQRLASGQTREGGWRYELDATDWDFSVSQWPLLAMREASLVGVEMPTAPLERARRLYYGAQNPDGGWGYQDKGGSYGSMTAAGLASVYIIADFLEPASGCPCRGGQSQRTETEADRRIDKGLEWLRKNYTAGTNPGKNRWHLYWLYCVERVGIAAGYKYFGTHNWYGEGADLLVKKQRGDGSWGDIPDTCFALLFLYKGRAPVLFNKLRFDGLWNMHRRDLANLTHYIAGFAKEQPFHWQIVDLAAPLEELHDAPILYISAESIPKWSDDDKRKLRAYTDTGGTIFFEASCGHPAVRQWFTEFANDVWPEWPLRPLSPEDPLWGGKGDSRVHPMKTRPDLLAVHDGIRSAVLFSPEDISCAWHMKAHAARDYLFDFGINLYAYATDGALLRAKLVGREPKRVERYDVPVKAGPRSTLRIARVRHGGNWEVGANYNGFARLAEVVKEKAKVKLEVTQTVEPKVTRGGVAPGDLEGFDVAYLAGTSALALSASERRDLKKFVAGGGTLWLEAALGAIEFDQSVRQFAEDLGWRLELLPLVHPLVTGRLGEAAGYNLTTGVEFRRALRMTRATRRYADLYGLFDGDRMIGLYSPLDVMFSLHPYEAYGCLGYEAPHAEAVATNIVLYLTTLK